MEKNKEKKTDIKLKFIISIVLMIIIVLIVVFVLTNKASNYNENIDVNFYYDIGGGKMSLSDNSLVSEYDITVSWDETKAKAKISGPNGKINSNDNQVFINEDGVYKITVGKITKEITLQKKSNDIKMFEITGEGTSKVTIKFNTNQVKSAVLYYGEDDLEGTEINNLNEELVLTEKGNYDLMLNNDTSSIIPIYVN